MSFVRVEKIEIENFRSFGELQTIEFPDESYKKPISIIGYNNVGKTNLMNAIKYGVGLNYVNENTFELKDIHNLNEKLSMSIKSVINASSYENANGNNNTAKGEHIIKSYNDIEKGVIASRNSEKLNYDDDYPSLYNIEKQYNVFYINFHEIKKEIDIKKTSWGNINSFLGKHIKYLIDNDIVMKSKKEEFIDSNKNNTINIMKNSDLEMFINSIKKNYKRNLRENNCLINFTLPDYEDIFLNMIFKIGLNGNNDNLVPISHFGDGYISMFVMAVIQSIGENTKEDKCLFLFEEPESFLHENHQEYFYKNVLCGLAQNGHQVIYTTHSAKMVDIFDTQSIIKLEYSEEKNMTLVAYNDINSQKISEVENYNQFIKSIEPNLNKILFSKKVIFVEGPNDLMVYNYVIKQKIIEKVIQECQRNNLTYDDKELNNFAETYLNFENIVIIPHHGKSTVILLLELCKHFKIDYFVITDFDLEQDYSLKLAIFNTETELKQSNLYNEKDPNTKGTLTKNWKIIKSAGIKNIHFNVDKLETVIGYGRNDKNSYRIWERINSITEFDEKIIPENLIEFLNLDKLDIEKIHGIK